MPLFYKAVFSLWLLALCLQLSAQKPFKKGDFVIGGMYQTHLLGKSPDFEKLYGINASYFVTDRWTIDYSLAYTYVPFGVSYFKLYGGAALAGYAASYTTQSVHNNGYWGILLLTLAIPEGVSYHIPVNDQTTISPYINLLTVDLSNKYWRMANTAGVRLNLVLNNVFNVSPYACLLVQYRQNSVGGTVGGFGAGVLGRWVF
jgi:hypothetical protein